MVVVREESFSCEAREIAEGPTTGAWGSELLAGANTWRPEFATWVLENRSVRARVVPDLGGRVLELTHLPTGTDVLGRPGTLEARASGPGVGHVRGAWLARGCSLIAPARDASRAPSLTPVDAAAEVPEGDGDPGRVVVAGLLPGSALGLQIVWSLDPERADLEADVCVRNRSLDVLEPFWSALALQLGPGEALCSPDGGAWLAVDERGTGCAVFADRCRVKAGRYEDGLLEVGRSHTSRTLLPRRAERWTCRVLPLVGVASPAAAMDGCVLGLQGTTATVLSATAFAGKLFVLGPAGQTLEAPLALRPGLSETFELPCEPTALSIRDAEGTTRLQWAPGRGLQPLGSEGGASLSERTFDDARTRAYFEGAALRAAGADPSGPLASAADAPEWEALAHVQLALHALSKGLADDVESHLDAALSTNAEDPLLWWLRAAAARLVDRSDPEAPDLPNAHYLAPLEPLLRAEGLLSQTPSLFGAPNPLLAPLAAHPDHAVEAAGTLVDARLWEDAARLIDELLRHQELSALRLLLAYAHLEATGMRAEVAEHLARLEPFTGPRPWRAVERRAIAALLQAFPDDPALGKLAGH